MSVGTHWSYQTRASSSVGGGGPGTVHVVVPEKVIGDDRPSRVYDRDSSVEREPFVALEAQKGASHARASRCPNRERASHDHRSWRNMRPWSAGAERPSPRDRTTRNLVRKTMPHCALGHLVVTIRQGGPAPHLRVDSKNILEGQCASRARLRITQCKRSI
jgi:hypothetical protein